MTGSIRRLIPALACLLAGGAFADVTHEGEVGGETWSPADGAEFSSESQYCGPTTSCVAAWHGIVVEPEATAVSLRGASIGHAHFAAVHYRHPGRAFDIGPDESARMIPGDADGDGRSALFWRESAPGTGLSWWRMDGGAVQAANCFEVPAEWRIAAVWDFDGDGTAGVLWRRTTDGLHYGWRMAGRTIVSQHALGVVDAAEHTAIALADFDGDAVADIAWRHAAGAHAAWTMSGFAVTGSIELPSPGAGYEAAATHFLDGLPRAGVAWRDGAGGLAEWRPGEAGFIALPDPGSHWELVAP